MITLIYRHRRENRAKCSLTSLEKREDFRFFTYPQDPLPDLTGYLVLQVGAPPLTAADKNKGLLLLDGTWKLAAKMAKSLSLAQVSHTISSKGLQDTALARISHTILREGVQDGASDLLSSGRKHCQNDKRSLEESKGDATDCADSPREREKCGLDLFFPGRRHSQNDKKSNGESKSGAIDCDKSRLQARSLPPHFRTAYPRRQTACPDPDHGLSSIEALYLAYLILERPHDGLLDHYHWKEEFLILNGLR